MKNRQYITTAIDYPNAAPHMGHVLEKVLADVIARWHRLQGREVRFQIGTDEHGTKIAQTAKKEGLTPKELVDRNVPKFEELYAKLQISYDNFVRTTDQKNHWPTVQELWERLHNAGALEQRSYTGLYCTGCERFLTKKDLIDGKCPDHGIPPQEVTETNWFFKLKEKEEWLKKILTDGTYRIIPENRAPETLQLLDRGLEDVSFSRPKTTLEWGIPVPGDSSQVMYVWCDALTNYISGIDYFGLSREGPSTSSGSFNSKKAGQSAEGTSTMSEPVGRVEWWNDATVTHVIGKDIARFHALIWPAMLEYAKIRVPDQLLIHGFLTSDGQKMSKSIGNVVNPVDVLEKYPVDALRFYLCHEVPVGNDGDFSWKRFGETYQAKLGNQLGNMLNRTLVMLGKDGGNVVVNLDDARNASWMDFWRDFSEEIDHFKIHSALQRIMNETGILNLNFNSEAPWTIKDDASKRIATLGMFAEALRHVALMLLPFIPESAQKMSKQLNVPYADQMLERKFKIKPEWKQWGGCPDWKTVGTPEILFPKVEEKA